MPSLRSILPVGVVLVLAAACTSETAGPDPGPEPEYIGSVLIAGPFNVLSALVTVDATGFDAAFLRMRTAGEPDMDSPAYPFVGDQAAPSALGMLAGRTYDIDVMLLDDGVEVLGETISFSTGALPGWLPTVVPEGVPADEGLVILSHPDGSIIVDNQGRVRWYLAEADPTLNSFQAHDNGQYTFVGLDDTEGVFRIVDEMGNVVGSLACVGRPTRFHDVKVLRDGTYWIMCDNPVPTDLSPRGGDPSGTVLWTTVQRVSPAGVLEFEFNAADHFSLDDIDQSIFVGATSVNITHGNAVDVDTDGNLLLSSRSLNEITKVNASTGAVIWRLGGLANQFTIVGETRDFARQHGVRTVGPGVIQLLDNGNAIPSRLVRYAIDEGTMTATRVLEFFTVENSFTPVGGSTQLVATDAALVSFGRAGKVVEVSAAGAELFDLTGLDGEYIFRAQRIPSLYSSERLGD
jgi:hypothetical protein